MCNLCESIVANKRDLVIQTKLCRGEWQGWLRCLEEQGPSPDPLLNFAYGSMAPQLAELLDNLVC